eukprot:m51a1_g898 hypothetical protein (892) ;mRNA; r:37771-41801
MVKGVVGIARERRSRWERRAPLTPQDVAELVRQGFRVIVQPSALRVFPDADYERAGAKISEDLGEANVILGVKERHPPDAMLANKAYAFFSHTIKAQPYNMPMLDAVLAKRITLLDYERITDEKGYRVIKLGYFAGVVGMTDVLSGLGARHLGAGFSTPFLGLSTSHYYASLEHLKDAVRLAGRRIESGGIPRELGPQVFAIVGTGEVGRGALSVFSLLPHKMLSEPSELPALVANKDFNHRQVYGLFLGPDQTCKRIARDAPFSMEEYLVHPELFQSVFATEIMPHCTVVVNAVYWDKYFPRHCTTEQLETMYRTRHPRLAAISDISCDPCGSFEFVCKETSIDHPFFVYDVEERRAYDGLAHPRGVLVCAVSQAPCELPAESSWYIGRSLAPFVPELAVVDWAAPLAELNLSPVLEQAVVAHQGELAPKARHIPEWRRKNGERRILVVLADAALAPAASACLAHLAERAGNAIVTAAVVAAPKGPQLLAELRGVAERHRTVRLVAMPDDPAPLLAESDIVVVFAGAQAASEVARACSLLGRHVVATVSDAEAPALAQMSEDFAALGATLLHSCADLEAVLAARVLSIGPQSWRRVEAWHGVVPAPDAATNCLGYHAGSAQLLEAALRSAVAPCAFKREGPVDPETEFNAAVSYRRPVRVLPALSTEGFPLGDESMRFARALGLDACKEVVRGVVTYTGFAEVVEDLHRMGFLAGDTKELTRSLLEVKSDERAAVARAARSPLTLELMDEYGMFDEASRVSAPVPPTTRIAALAALLGAPRRLGLVHLAGEDRCDVTISHVLADDGRETRTASIVLRTRDEEDPEAPSANAAAVGVPTAVCVRLLMSGTIAQTGLVSPFVGSVGAAVLQELERCGFRVITRSRASPATSN